MQVGLEKIGNLVDIYQKLLEIYCNVIMTADLYYARSLQSTAKEQVNYNSSLKLERIKQNLSNSFNLEMKCFFKWKVD